MLLLQAFGAVLAATLVAANMPTLFVVFPNLMRFDSPEEVIIDHRGDADPVPCRVSLLNYPNEEKTFSVRDVTAERGKLTKLNVTTKLTDLVQGSLSPLNYVYVRVQCTMDHESFDRKAAVLLTGTKGYLFLQTDKPIYKPKEIVSIRAVSLNPNMRPANTNFTMEVLNPHKTIFERFEGSATKGFFSKTIRLPEITVLGNWSVRASYQNIFQPQSLTSIVSFEVREYVLPTFSVDIKTPDFYLPSNTEIQVTVTARYVYKEEVKGRLTVGFSLLKKDGSCHAFATKTFSNFNGKKTVALAKSDFKDKWFPDVGSRLVVEATVTEEASGNRETNSDSSAMFVNSPYVISFERTAKYFKPGLPYSLKLALKYASGAVAGQVDVYVFPTAKQTATGHNGRVNFFKDDAQSGRFKTDAEGLKMIILDVPNDSENLTIQVKTTDPSITPAEQAERNLTLTPHTTVNNEFLAIQLLDKPSARIPVGRKLGIRVDFTENANKNVTFMVLTRGRVVRVYSAAVNGLSKHENINITSQMAPQARLVVYYVSSSSGGTTGELIADSLVLDVIKTCEEELELSHGEDDGDDYKPGELVTFTIKSAKDSLVSILGVDKAVYLLSERDILSRNKMFDTIMDQDLGCGPGSGRNVGEVFRDSGVYVLTNRADAPTSRRPSPKCKKIRKRRAVERVRRGVDSNDRTAALNQYNNTADRACCEEGFDQQVLQDQRSCDAIAEARGMILTGCRIPFLRCCQLGKDANTPSGRSWDDEEDEIDESIIDRRREDFRETWINELFEMQGSEQQPLRSNLPDSITTWVISGVSVSESAGMCVAKPINVTAKKYFFVHLDLPYAAVRGEQLEVKATVYNFGIHQITALVWLEGDRSKLCFNGNSDVRTPKRRIKVGPNRGKKVTIPVVPLQVGNIDITVTAITSLAGDKVTRRLKTTAEGVTRQTSFSSRLDPEGRMGGSGSGNSSVKVMIDKANKNQTISIPLEFPADVIPGTKVCSVTITGSLLGPMVPSPDLNMADKIVQPIGCGEQTMMYMGPLVYSTRYMLRTKTLSGELNKTAHEYIISGFQAELTYKKPDGSYAAYQHRKSSSWLTAFVAKVFCQASLLLPDKIGKEVAQHATEAINWLLTNAQGEDGRFYEKHALLDTGMAGQSMKNPVTFTAFVVEAIFKCGNVDGINIKTGNTADKLRLATNYLVGNKDSQNGPYEQAILTYALALQKNSHRFAANQKLRRMSSMDPATGMRYWNPDGSVVPDDTTPSWYKETPSAYAIETASYALLAQLAIGESEDYFQYSGPIASWLIRQRTKTGAFVSTTDTVIGLEALTEYAQRLSRDSRSELNMNVRVFLRKGRVWSFHLTKANAYTPQTRTKNLPIDSKLVITVNGTGIGQVLGGCQYNSPGEGEVCMFDLKVTSEEGNVPVDELNGQVKGNQARERPRGVVQQFVNKITIEYSYIGPEERVWMSILDVTLFTGFLPVLADLDRLVRKNVIDRYEVTSSSVLMYLGAVKKGKPTSVTFRAKLENKVNVVQPAAVKLYDYYEPEKHHCTKFYHPTQNSSLLATFCDKKSNERRVCQCAASRCTKKRKIIGDRRKLREDACDKYDYVVKVRAGRTDVKGALANMKATIELYIKNGSMEYLVNNKMQFVWNTICEDTIFIPGRKYLVMGKDGVESVDKTGAKTMQYELDSKSYVLKWDKKTNRSLNVFANDLIRNGCGM